jgi:bifunctional lysine-specific demethylase and histidyl-hydroxylase MINA
MSIATAIAALPAAYRRRLDSLFAPIGLETFLRDYHGKRHIHLPGRAEAVADVMSWDELQRLLNMVSYWTPSSLMLSLDRKVVSGIEYSRPAIGQTGHEVLRPHPERVQDWMARGATLILNDIDQLNGGLNEISAALQALTGGRAQGNLYCSRRQRQAFAPHFDTHDVFAVHCAGVKVWRVFEGQEQSPIAHRLFKWAPEEWAKRHGKVLEEVTMRPGDLLYLPRGRYHDALASEEGAIHIAFGLTQPKAIDLMPLLMEAMIAADGFRDDLPLPHARGAQAWESWQSGFAARLSALVTSPQFRDGLGQLLGQYPYPRETYDLPAIFAQGARYRLTRDDFSIAAVGGTMVLASAKGQVALPPPLVAPLRWVVGRPTFSEAELQQATPELEPAARAKLVEDLMAMKVLAHA